MSLSICPPKAGACSAVNVSRANANGDTFLCTYFTCILPARTAAGMSVQRTAAAAAVRRKAGEGHTLLGPALPPGMPAPVVLQKAEA